MRAIQRHLTRIERAMTRQALVRDQEIRRGRDQELIRLQVIGAAKEREMLESRA